MARKKTDLKDGETGIPPVQEQAGGVVATETPPTQPDGEAEGKPKPLVSYRLQSDRTTSIELAVWANTHTTQQGEQYEQQQCGGEPQIVGEPERIDAWPGEPLIGRCAKEIEPHIAMHVHEQAKANVHHSEERGPDAEIAPQIRRGGHPPSAHRVPGSETQSHRQAEERRVRGDEAHRVRDAALRPVQRRKHDRGEREGSEACMSKEARHARV